MSIEVIRPGLCTTIQDLGRQGYQKHGVIVGGAMDPYALQIANMLVGNTKTAAAIEVTLAGPKLHFHKSLLVAIGGGDLTPSIQSRLVPLWRPIWVKEGSILQFGKALRGCRAYIAVAGGVDVPKALGSRSTYLRARLGGFDGRALRAGDRINMKQPGGISQQLIEKFALTGSIGKKPFEIADWFVDPKVLPLYDSKVVQVMPGPHLHKFTLVSQDRFFHGEYDITSQSDRMGYRLSGPTLALGQPLELISEAVCAGTIQVPPDGQPIILMADRQTTGGYPKIGYVATADLPILAQLKPGMKLQFRKTTLREAQQRIVEREVNLKIIKHRIRLLAGRR